VYNVDNGTLGITQFHQDDALFAEGEDIGGEIAII